MPCDVTDLLSRICDLVVDEAVECACTDDKKCGQMHLLDVRKVARDLCGNNMQSGAAALLEDFIDRATAAFKEFPAPCWRSLHTDACIVRSACDLLSDRDSVNWELTVRRLDLAIIISGATGYGRQYLIYEIIENIQTDHLPLDDDPFIGDIANAAPSPITRLPLHSSLVSELVPPSLGAFTREFYSSPFILRGFLSDWPALNDHPWSSRSYLLRVAGRARTVPVELGADYRTENWNQSLMGWEDFLRGLTSSSEVRYLAQYNLLAQFPALRGDIVVPDYVYADIPDSSGRAEPELNAWLGARGAGSPAHFDQFANCYCIVSGRRTVWLAPPKVSTALNTDGNTAQEDVYSQQPTEAFVQRVLPHAQAAELGAGDMLYLPRGWWHAFRVEDTSFAVSMWF